MRFGTFRHALFIGVLAMYCQVSLADDKTPTPPPVQKQVSVKRDCADAKGATKKECDKVAAKMDAQAADPQAQPATEEAESGADYVHHSSPAMRTPAEVAQDKAEAKSDKAKAKSERKTDSSKPAPK
jgi:cell division septum initiation protein DivIVA